MGGGVRFRRTPQGAWVYAVRGGRVSAVAVASRALASRPGALRIAVRQLLAAKAASAATAFVPSQAQAEAEATGRPVTGRTLAGTSDPRLNAALALLCGLGVHSGSPTSAAASLLGR